MRRWEKYAGEMSKGGGDRVTTPSMEKLLLSTELVLDQNGKLREANRVAGENEVGTLGKYFVAYLDVLLLHTVLVFNLS